MADIKKFHYPKSNRMKIASKNFDEISDQFEAMTKQYELRDKNRKITEKEQDEEFEAMLAGVMELNNAGDEYEAACREKILKNMMSFVKRICSNVRIILSNKMNKYSERPFLCSSYSRLEAQYTVARAKSRNFRSRAKLKWRLSLH